MKNWVFRCIQPVVLCMFLLLGSGLRSFAQNEFDLWAARVGWDGVTPWRFFLNIAPETLGPNALPVLRLQRGKIRSLSEIELRPEFHFNEGDQTYDLFLRAYLPIAPEKVALEVFMVTYEKYQFSEEIRDLRAARTSSGEGSTEGDVFVSTIVQLLKDKPKFPDVALSIQLKTASGGKLEDARYTDAPAYAFDLSAGKSFNLSDNTHSSLRLHGMLGFYVWQIYDFTQRQNDAIAFGLGTAIDFSSWEISQDISGYAGYIGNGDRPVVYRIDLTKKANPIQWRFGYQIGLRDFPYQTLRLSAIYRFPLQKN